MLKFHSAKTRMVNTARGVAECLEAALGPDNAGNCDLVVIHAALGHDFKEMLAETRRLAPKARVVAASGCGVVGRDGVSESMKDIAIMAIQGKDFVLAHEDGIYGANSYEKSVEMAKRMKAQNPDVRFIYFLASGIDIANDRCIAGFESVFGPKVTIFGATSSDNMRGIVSYQGVDGDVYQHAAFAIGFTDPTLEVDTQATHGFVAVGEPLVVTRAEGNRIHEFNGRPACTPAGWAWPRRRPVATPSRSARSARSCPRRSRRSTATITCCASSRAARATQCITRRPARRARASG